jgi:drug/metabolite transporter (DMT)-like permease
VVPLIRGLKHLQNELKIVEEGQEIKVILLLVLSVTMVSSASILIRYSTSHPLAIVFWRTLYGSIVMALVGLLRGDIEKAKASEAMQNWPWFTLIGVVLSLHFSTWFTSLFLTTVAASVVLVNTSPIFTAIFSTIVLGESLRRKSWAGVIIAVVGAILLAWNDLLAVGAGALLGDILALFGALFLAIYFIGGRRFAKGIPITAYTTIVYLTAALVTFVVCIVLQINILIFEPTEILIFLALAIFPTALGHSVNNYLLTLVPAYVVSSAVIAEPVGATLLAVVFLGEIPPVFTFLGFAVILIGVSLVLLDISRRREETPSL